MVSAQGAVEDVLKVAGLAWAVAWFLNIGVAFADQPSLSRAPLWTGVLLAVQVVAWLGLLIGRIDGRVFTLVAMVATLGQVALFDVTTLKSSYLYLTGAINSVVVVGAVIIPRRMARTTGLPLIATAGLILTVNLISADALGDFWHQLIIATYYGLVDLMAVSTATSVLRAAAMSSDEESDRVRQLIEANARNRAERIELERVGRLLHDTVVNTLGAIRRGVADDSVAQLRERCRMDLEQIARFRLSSPSSASVPLSSVVDRLASRATALGLRAKLSANARTLLLSASIAESIFEVAGELLTNVSKHTADPRVEISIAVDVSELKRITVEVRDFGPGWDGSGRRSGFRSSVEDRLTIAGGGWNLVKKAERGTAVRFWLPLSREAIQPDEVLRSTVPQTARAALRRGAAVPAMWLISLGAVQSALAWGTSVFVWSLSACAFLSVLAFALSRAATTGPLPTWLQWALVPAMAAVVALPQWGLQGCALTEPGAWGPDGAAALILLMVLLGRGWQPAAAASLGLFIGLGLPLALAWTNVEDCGAATGTTLLIELGTALALHLYRARAESLLARSRQQWVQAMTASAEEIAEASRQRVRASRLDRTISHVGVLVQDLAEGRANPQTIEVRAAAGTHERTLRGLLQIDSGLGDLGNALSSTLLRAAEIGKSVRLGNAEFVVPPTPDQAAVILELLSAIVESKAIRSDISLTIFEQAGESSLHVVAESEEPLLRDWLATKCASAGIEASEQDLAGERLLRLSWRGTT